jgi:hypothetical protein
LPTWEISGNGVDAGGQDGIELGFVVDAKGVAHGEAALLHAGAGQCGSAGDVAGDIDAGDFGLVGDGVEAVGAFALGVGAFFHKESVGVDGDAEFLEAEVFGVAVAAEGVEDGVGGEDLPLLSWTRALPPSA